MAVTSASFLVSFPEFKSASVPLIEAKLAAAVLQTDAAVWVGKTDLGVELLAAHLLAIAPNGQFARLVAKDGSTIYEKQRRDMELQVTSGFRVL